MDDETFSKWLKTKHYVDGLWHDSYNGYVRTLAPGHRRADRRGRVPYQVLVYERHYNCCLTDWTIIDHINRKRDDNRIENLRPMRRLEHARMHGIESVDLERHNEIEKRRCSKCGKGTAINRPGKIVPSLKWYTSKITGKWLCHNCWRKENYNPEKRRLAWIKERKLKKEKTFVW